MNENKIYKEYKNKMKISPVIQQGDSTNAVVYSFDLETSKFSYELKKNGEPFSLATASDVSFVLRFGGSNPEEYPTAVLIGDIEDMVNGKVSFVMPKRYLGFDGRVLGEVNIRFTNGQSLTAGHFSFVMKPSYIDEGVEIAQQVYVERFEDLKKIIEKQSEDVDEILAVMQEDIKESNDKVDEIKDLIVQNDVLKKVEAGSFEEFREWDNTIINKMKSEFLERGVNPVWYGMKENDPDLLTGENNKKAINKAIETAKVLNKPVIMPKGIFYVKAHNELKNSSFFLSNDGAIKILDNTVFIITEDCEIRACANKEKAYNIIYAHNVNNWTIVNNGKIIGTKHNRTDSNVKGEWGYGLSVQGAKNYKILGGSYTECFGDGINLQVFRDGVSPPIPCENGYIDKVSCFDNYRQGMSIESSIKLVVNNSKFTKTSGTLPTSGVDIEPVNENNIVDDVLFYKCEFTDNDGYGLVTNPKINSDGNSNVRNIRTKSCKFAGNKLQYTSLQITKTNFISENDEFINTNVNTIDSDFVQISAILRKTNYSFISSDVSLQRVDSRDISGYAFINFESKTETGHSLEINGCNFKGKKENFETTGGLFTLFMLKNFKDFSIVNSSLAGSDRLITSESSIIEDMTFKNNVISDINLSVFSIKGTAKRIEFLKNNFSECLKFGSTNMIIDFNLDKVEDVVYCGNTCVGNKKGTNKLEKYVMEFSGKSSDVLLTYFGNTGLILRNGLTFKDGSLIINQSGVMIVDELPDSSKYPTIQFGTLVYSKASSKLYFYNGKNVFKEL